MTEQEDDREKIIRECSESIVNQLFNENREFCAIYGTTILQSSTRQYSKTVAERFDELQQQFNSIDADGNHEITYSEFLQFFRNRNSNFTEEELKKLFAFFDIDKSKTITINEFVQNYLFLEESIKLKKTKLETLEKDLEKNLEDFQKKFKQNENEELNDFGISYNSTFTIKVLDGQVIDCGNLNSFDLSCKLIAKLIQGNKVIQQLEAVSKIQGSNLLFEERLPFSIKDPRDLKVRMELVHYGTTPPTLIGKIELIPSDLRDQNYLDNSFPFTPENDNFTDVAKIRMSVRYLYSVKKYYQDKIKSTEDQIITKEKDIQDIDLIVKEMESKPFCILFDHDLEEIRKLLSTSDDINKYLRTDRQSVYDKLRQSQLVLAKVKNNIKSPFDVSPGGSRQNSDYNKGGLGNSNIINTNNNMITNNLKNMKKSNFFEGMNKNDEVFFTHIDRRFHKGRTILLCNLALLAITLFNFTSKNEFLNFLMCLIGIVMCRVNNIQKKWIEYIFLLCSVSECIDILWFFFHTGNKNLLNSFFKSISYILTLGSIIIKALLFVTYLNEKRND